MSDEVEARMWDEDSVPTFNIGDGGVYYESSFASTEHLDRAPLLADESYTEVQVSPDEGEDHCHWKCNTEPPSAVPQLVAALALCGFFMVCEVIGGYLAGSLSVMCDAAHMLSDCGGFALALLAFHCAKRPPDLHMSYGYKRAEVLGAMVSVLLIWILTGIFVFVAGTRLHSDDYEIDPNVMMVVSGAGLAFNIILAMVLHGCGSSIAHHHSHGGAACSHSHQPHNSGRPQNQILNMFKRTKKYKMANGHANGDCGGRQHFGGDSGGHDRNINLRAALIHVIGDLIQSCGVLLASILIKFYPWMKVVDPICTFIFSILVLCTSARVVRDALSMLMQGVPRHFPYRQCVSALSSIGGVRHVHSLHVWALSSHHTVLSGHIAIDSLSNPEEILRSCQSVLRTSFKIHSATLQVERYEEVMTTCPVCVSQPALNA